MSRIWDTTPSQNVAKTSGKISRADADKVYDTLRKLILSQCSPVLFEASLREAIENMGFPVDYRPIGYDKTLLHCALLEEIDNCVPKMNLAPEQSSYAQVLINAGSDVNLFDYNTGENALIMLSGNTEQLLNNFEQVRDLFNEIMPLTSDINFVSQDGLTALGKFCRGWAMKWADNGRYLSEPMDLNDRKWDNHKQYLDALIVNGASLDLVQSDKIYGDEYRLMCSKKELEQCRNNEKQMLEYIRMRTEELRKDQELDLDLLDR